MNTKIITNIHEDVKNFYNYNVKFKTLQVQKSSGIFGKVKKEYIAKYPTRYKGIQLNSNGYTNALCFDCDHNDVMLYEDYNLPKPTITTINQNNGKHHHIYYLDNPIPHLISKPKTTEYLQDIYDSLSHRLEADVNYTNTITKNFLNKKDFRVIVSLNKYKLEDFKELVIAKKQRVNTKVLETAYSRHIALFDEIRYFGYSIARECIDEISLYSSILNYANRINNGFEEPIKVKYIVRSVSNFCWLNRDNFNKNSWNWDGYTKQDSNITSKNHKLKWEKYRIEKRKAIQENFAQMNFASK